MGGAHRQRLGSYRVVDVGAGRVYSDVGRVTFQVTFSEDPIEEPTVELISVAGQHDDAFPTLLICEALAE